MQAIRVFSALLLVGGFSACGRSSFLSDEGRTPGSVPAATTNEDGNNTQPGTRYFARTTSGDTPVPTNTVLGSETLAAPGTCSYSLQADNLDPADLNIPNPQQAPVGETDSSTGCP